MISRDYETIFEVIKNEKLWKKVVIPPDQKFVRYLGSYTTNLTIGFSDDSGSHWDLTEPLITSIQSSCSSLEKLTIVNCEFNIDIKLSKFPQTISHLKFVNVSMPNRVKCGIMNSVKESPFFKVQESLPQLKSIEVEASKYYLADIVAASLGNIPIDVIMDGISIDR